MSVISPHDRDTVRVAARDALDVLNVLQRLKQRVVSALRASATVSLPRLKVLAALHAGPVRAGDLAHTWHLTPAAITELCDGLVADGLVARHKDPRDRRVVLHELTSAGRRELVRAERIAAATVAEVLRGMAPETRRHLDVGIRGMRDQLERLRES